MKKRGKFELIAMVLTFILIFSSCSFTNSENVSTQTSEDTTFTIISGSENKVYEDSIVSYGKRHGIDVHFEYAGTLDIMDKINNGGEYDGVWASNSIWLYMLENSSQVKNSRFTSISPVVFAIDKTKAQELGYVGKDISMNKIVKDIQNKFFNFIMPSITQTNAGASFYLGMLYTLSGSPQVLSEYHLKNKDLKTKLLKTFQGVSRTVGDEDFLDELYQTGDYNAVVGYESSIIELNKQLIEDGKTPLYLVYPKEGVSLSDSPFAYIDRSQNKEKAFSLLQDYLLSSTMQKAFLDSGRRVWYGGTNESADKTTFNPNWGIDTTKYLQVAKYPSVSIIKKSLSLYQTALRKPTKIIFCLDYSGSMSGEGKTQLTEAMHYIFTKETAAKYYMEFTDSDTIGVILFDYSIKGSMQAKGTSDLSDVLKYIDDTDAYGSTNIYKPSIRALEMLKEEDLAKYNCSVVLMTDGESNAGSYNELETYYKSIDKDIPIYSIMFGYANDEQLNTIADLTNGKVFDGRTNLIDAFKAVRGYN